MCSTTTLTHSSNPAWSHSVFCFVKAAPENREKVRCPCMGGVRVVGGTTDTTTGKPSSSVQHTYKGHMMKVT